MGDNETLAALAAQVDDLRGKVAKLQGVVASWNARLETEGIGATARGPGSADSCA